MLPFFVLILEAGMELKRLTNKFYSTYNRIDYPNILRKINRSYSVYKVEIEGINYCIPVKTNIKHSSSFLFKDSSRRKAGEKPGLDFKYSVVIRDESYIGEDGVIDRIESKFIEQNKEKIIYQYLRYIKDYKKYVSNPISKFWDSWRFSHTSLEYFWDEMGFEVDDKESKKREIEISYNLYCLVKELCNDGGFKLSDFYVRRLDKDTISISCLGKFLIKELSLEDVEKYLKIIVMYDEFSNINYGMTKSDLYDELLNKLLSFSHDLHKIVV